METGLVLNKMLQFGKCIEWKVNQIKRVEKDLRKLEKPFRKTLL